MSPCCSSSLAVAFSGGGGMRCWEPESVDVTWAIRGKLKVRTVRLITEAMKRPIRVPSYSITTALLRRMAVWIVRRRFFHLIIAFLVILGATKQAAPKALLFAFLRIRHRSGARGIYSRLARHGNRTQ